MHATATITKPIVVEVRGDKRPPGSTTLTHNEVRALPGAFGDAFRAVGALPGVTPVVSGLPYFYVRGAPLGTVGTFIDGIRVPLLYHVGLGPAVVAPALIDRVDFYPGAYPARFGRFTGAIVAADTAPPRQTFHTEAQVRLLDAGASVEAPVRDGRGSVLVAGRYSYSGLLLPLFAPHTALAYWDYQARASLAVGPRDAVRVFAFGSYDYLGQDDKALVDTGFHRVDLRERHVAEDGTKLDTSVTLGLDRTGADAAAQDRSLRVATSVEHRAGPRAVLRSGADVELDAYRLGATDPAVQALLPSRTDIASGAWSDVVLEPEPGVTVTPGARVDYYASDGVAAVAVDPRISARFAVSRHVRLVHALGIASAPPGFVAPVPGLAVAGLRGGLQRSVQSSAGVEWDLPADVHATVTLFQNAFLGMTDPFGTFEHQAHTNLSDELSTRNIDQLDTRSLGSSVGVELFVHRALTRRLGGFIAYTLSRSMRSLGRSHFPSNADRTHVLNVALSYAPGRGWRVGTRLLAYSGFPVLQNDPLVPRSEHPARVPPFYRVDLRAEKRWPLGQRGYWALVLEVLNATLNKEPVDTACNEPTTCHTVRVGPVTIPSIGVEASY